MWEKIFPIDVLNYLLKSVACSVEKKLKISLIKQWTINLFVLLYQPLKKFFTSFLYHSFKGAKWNKSVN
jgi:hypothetical protein